MSKPNKTAPKSVTPRQPWVEAFRSGKHTDARGIEHQYSDADIDTMAHRINAQVSGGFIPPVVTGHPASDSPRQAGVFEAVASGSSPRTLFVRVDEVVPAFAEAVQEGQYKYVSVALYPDMGLRHLGVLGGSNPAVKGMDALEFGEGMFAEADAGKNADELRIFSEEWSPVSAMGAALLRISWRIQSIGSMLGSMRDQLIATSGSVDDADKVYPSYVIDSLRDFDLSDAIGQMTPPTADPSFSDAPPQDGTPPSAPAAPPAHPGSAVDVAGGGREHDQAGARAFSDRLDAMASDGRLTPVQRKPIEALFKSLSSSGEGVMYSEDEPSFAALNDLLNSMPKQLEFSEIIRPNPTLPTTNPLIADADRRSKA